MSTRWFGANMDNKDIWFYSHSLEWPTQNDCFSPKLDIHHLEIDFFFLQIDQQLILNI